MGVVSYTREAEETRRRAAAERRQIPVPVVIGADQSIHPVGALLQDFQVGPEQEEEGSELSDSSYSGDDDESSEEGSTESENNDEANAALAPPASIVDIIQYINDRQFTTGNNRFGGVRPFTQAVRRLRQLRPNLSTAELQNWYRLWKNGRNGR